jgi:hypothetical protein
MDINFCLKRKCFKDVDYDEAGNGILPPFTSLLQQDDLQLMWLSGRLTL